MKYMFGDDIIDIITSRLKFIRRKKAAIYHTTVPQLKKLRSSFILHPSSFTSQLGQNCFHVDPLFDILVLIMTDLHSVYCTNCQVLIRGGGDFAQANSWFLSLTEDSRLCWNFCTEIVTLAKESYDEEFEADQRNDIATVLKSPRLYESFFAVKLLQNVMLMGRLWSQVPEEQRMQTRQMLAGLLFHERHPLYQAPLLRNQLSCTLANMFAMPSLDTAMDAASHMCDYHITSKSCRESTLPYQQFLMSLTESSSDINVLTSVVCVLRELPHAAASLLRSKHAHALAELPPTAHSAVAQSLNIGYAEVSTFRPVLLACFHRAVQGMMDQIACFGALTCPTSTLAAAEDLLETCALLQVTLDSVVAWTEASSSSCAWLSPIDFARPADCSTSHTPVSASMLEKLEQLLTAICNVLQHLNSLHSMGVLDCKRLVSAFQTSLHKMFELFGFVLMSSSSEAASSTLLASGTPEEHQVCSGTMCIFRSVSRMTDCVIMSGNQKYGLDEKLQVRVTVGCLKDTLCGLPTAGGRDIVALLQNSLYCCGLTLNSSDSVVDERNDDGLDGVFLGMSEVVSLLLEKHLDTLILLHESPLDPLNDSDAAYDGHGHNNIRMVPNLIYFCMLLPHSYAKVTILESLGSLLLDCVSFRSRKHAPQKQHVMSTFLHTFFPVSVDGNIDVVGMVGVVVLLSQCVHESDEHDERASEALELRGACAEVLRLLWRLLSSSSSPLASASPILLTAVHELHLRPLCTSLREAYCQQSHQLQSTTQLHTDLLEQSASRISQLQNQLNSWLFYLSIFVEETVEQFSLDEDANEDEEEEEDEEEDVNEGSAAEDSRSGPSTDKKYSLTYTLFFREWLVLLASVTNEIRVLLPELTRCQDLSSRRALPLPCHFNMLRMYCSLWESFPFILRAVDPHVYGNSHFFACKTAVEFTRHDGALGCAQDVQVYAQLLVGAWDLLHQALFLSSAEPSRRPGGNMTPVVTALHRIAENCKYASAANAPQVLDMVQSFVVREDQVSKQDAALSRSRESLTSSGSLQSMTGGSKFFTMMAAYVTLIGLDRTECGMSKDQALQVVLESILVPLEDIFSQIVQASGSQQQQFQLLSGNLSLLLSLCSRLRGFMLPLSADRHFATFVHKLIDFLINMLALISELYVFAFSASTRGSGVGGVMHVEASEEDYSCGDEGARSGHAHFSMLHDVIAGVLCSLMDTSNCPASSDAFQKVGRIVQHVQSAKLIQLVTVLIRWRVNDASAAREDAAYHQQAGQLVAMTMYHCRLELDAILQVQQSGDECSLSEKDLQWLSNELAMIWRLSRQVCSSYPPLLVFTYTSGGDNETDTVLSQLLCLCLAVVNIVGEPSMTTGTGLSLHLMPLITLFDQLHLRAFCHLRTVDVAARGRGGGWSSLDDAFASLFVPAAQEMLFLLLMYILYQDPSPGCSGGGANKSVKLLFSRIYLLLLDVLGFAAVEGAELTTALIDTVYWPICSGVFHSSACKQMGCKVMAAHGIGFDSLPALPEDVVDGVFLLAPAASPELQYVSAKVAAETIGAVFLRHGGARGQRSDSSLQSRNMMKALAEIETMFKVV